MLRQCTGFLLIAFAVFGLGRAWYVAKDGFAINRVRCKMEKGPEQSIALDGEYRYLGRGRQCYVFESRDGRFVLKLPRFDRYNFPLRWKMWGESEAAKKLYADRQGGLIFMMESLRIAAEELKEWTGVIALHQQETQSLRNDCVLIDRLGRRFRVDLNKMVWVLQEKKALMMPLVEQAIVKGDRARARAMLTSMLDYLAERARRGIFNRDPSFLDNFGWDEDKGSIQIDIGSFYHKGGYCESLLDGTGPLRAWLEKKDPGLFASFQHDLDERMVP